MTEPIYRGDGYPTKDRSGKRYPYLAHQELVDVINLAIALERPLLVKGPAGCGKTKLAEAVAHEIGETFIPWHIKSTSKAQDGLYSIDMLRRLQDAQLGDKKAQDVANYLTFGPLGKAIMTPGRPVLLIDEIDKADIDFPNDLLRELDENKFSIPELKESKSCTTGDESALRYEYEGNPIVIITSNDEKELPEAFLRRCLFYYIAFPSREQLLGIVKVNMTADPRFAGVKDALIENAVTQILRVMAIKNFRKDPSTSELIDWIKILQSLGVRAEDLEHVENLQDLPQWKLLFKHFQDHKNFERAASERKI